MWKYQYFILLANSALNIVTICIKRTPNTGNACGHISHCAHKNHIHKHKQKHIKIGIRIINATVYKALH